MSSQSIPPQPPQTPRSADSNFSQTDPALQADSRTLGKPEKGVDELQAELDAANAKLIEAQDEIGTLTAQNATLTAVKEALDEDAILIQRRMASALGGITFQQATAVHNRQLAAHKINPRKYPHPRDVKFRNAMA